jgi:glycosyltransferase involved in cell wall biosynthesis
LRAECALTLRAGVLYLSGLVEPCSIHPRDGNPDRAHAHLYRDVLTAHSPMSRSRILFVEASVGGVLGGSLTGIVQLIQRMNRRRFEPAVVLYETKDIARKLEADGVKVHVLPPLPEPTPDGGRGRLGRAVVRMRDLASVITPRARALVDLFRQEQPDIVYLANGVTTNLDGVIAAAICGLPIIVHEKGLRRAGPVERFMSKWVDTCIGMTDNVTAHVKSRRLTARRFLTIYDGIDTEQFAPGGGPAVRRELGIPTDAPLVGIVGHIQEWKGQLVVAQAVARARATCPELRCLIIGGVHRMGTEYGERLRAFIAEQGLGAHVILTGARSDVPACLDALDVAIHSSTRPEPFGRVLIEAMALGKPLIAPREGGPREIVVDGETGILVEPRDPDALAAAIVRLVTNPEERARMGRAARERVENVFDIRHHVRAIEAVFEDVMAARPVTAAVTKTAPAS